MIDLREQIGHILDNSYDRGFLDGRDSTDEVCGPRGVDDILALIAEAMLSDEAVEAAVLGSFRWEVRNMPGMPYTEDQYKSFRRENRNWIENVRSELTAALAAAGITPGDAREGGEGE